MYTWGKKWKTSGRTNAKPLMTAVLRRKGQGSGKISGHTTANSCDMQPKLLADNKVEFASLVHNSI